MFNSRSGILTSIFLSLFAVLFAASATAQDVNSVVDNMRSVYQNQLAKVDTYIVETDRHISYFRKVTKNGEEIYETRTEMKKKNKDQGPMGMDTANPSSTTPYGLDYDALKKHATYDGSQKVLGQKTHVLQVDKPEKVMRNENTKGNLKNATYFVDAEKHVPIRVIIKVSGVGGKMAQKSNKPSTVTIDMKQYKNVKGVLFPHRTEILFELGMSKQQKKRLKQSLKQLENMSGQQKKMMKRMLGDNLDQLKKMIAEEPVVSEVTDLKVNVKLPDNAFPN